MHISERTASQGEVSAFATCLCLDCVSMFLNSVCVSVFGTTVVASEGISGVVIGKVYREWGDGLEALGPWGHGTDLAFAKSKKCHCTLRRGMINAFTVV